MDFQPQANQTLQIDGVAYRIAEHPAAPGMPYGQEGRQAIVYQLVAGQEKRALKVFKPRYSVPALVGLARRLEPIAVLPGLQVCKRTVLTPQRNEDLLRQYPDLTYAVVMPWVDGPTWMEVMLDKRALSPEQSLTLARALAEVLAGMEQEGLAHCDLSGPNVLLPYLAGFDSLSQQSQLELVDVEQLYGPGLHRPAVLPSGSLGYAHHPARQEMWSPEADRFAGAVLLAEMLGSCNNEVREAAWGESYFDPDEMQQDGDHFRLLDRALLGQWGSHIARLLEQAWMSDTLSDCPTFGQWLVMLPQEVPDRATLTPELPVSLNPQGLSEAKLVEWPQQRAQNVAAPVRPSSSPKQGSLDEASGQLTPEGTVQANSIATLFNEGVEAYQQGDWARAKELLGEVVRQQPSYRSGKQQAVKLLLDAERHMAAPPHARRRFSWIFVPSVLLLALLGFGAIAVYQAQLTAAHAQAEATATAATAQSLQATATILTQAEATAQTQSTTTAHAQATTTAYALQLAADEHAQQTITAHTQETAVTLASQMTATTEAQVVETRQVQATSTAQAQQTATAQAVVAFATTQAIQQATAQAGQTSQAATAEATVTVQAKAAEATATVKAILALTPSIAPSPRPTKPPNTATPAPKLSEPISPASANRLALLKTLNIRDGHVSSVAFSPDGQTLVAGSNSGGPILGVRLYRVSDGTLLRTLPVNDGIESVAVSPDGQFFAASSYTGGDSEGKTYLWAFSSGQLINSVASRSGYQIEFSPDGKVLASAGAQFHLSRASDLSPQSTLDTGGWSSSLSFSRDGQTLAMDVNYLDETGTSASNVQVWRTSDWTRIHTFGPSGPMNPEGKTFYSADRVAMSPDGRILAVFITGVTFASNGGFPTTYSLQLWNADNGSVIQTLSGQKDPPVDMAFSPDGQIFTTTASGPDNTVRLWSTSSGTLLTSFTAQGTPEGLAYSADGRILVVGWGDGKARLYTVR